jgi:peptidoglycan/xylan/chitin deacetylase (PgdA/CDA1 family)
MAPFSLTVLMYHYVRDPGDQAEAGSGIPGLPVAHFESQLDDATRHHTMLSWPELRAALLEGKPLPHDPCLLTFDDGLCDHYLNVFPILKRRGLSGLFFTLARQQGTGLTLAHKIHFLLARLGLEGLHEAIRPRLTLAQQGIFEQAGENYRARGYASVDVLKSILQRDFSADANAWLSDLFEEHIGSETQIAEGYFLQPEQMREMAASGMHFGGHSRTHPWLDWVSDAQQAEEIKASADWLGHALSEASMTLPRLRAPDPAEPDRTGQGRAGGVEADPWAFAYPYGGFNARSSQHLQAHGFAAAFTTVGQTTHRDPFFIGRLDAEQMITDV